MSLFIDTVAATTFKDLDSARDFLAKENRRVVKTDNPATITLAVDNDNKLNLDFGSGPMTVTRGGFDYFCKSIGVPPKFVTRLPFENIQKDVYASLVMAEIDSLSFLTKGNTIIGATTKLDFVTAEETLTTLARNSQNQFKDIAVVNDSNLIVNLVRDTNEILPNDSYGTGIQVFLPEGTGSSPFLGYYTYRLVCSNGAITKSLVESVRFSKKMDKNRMLELLDERLNQPLNEADEVLVSAARNMQQAQIEEDDRRYYNRFIVNKFIRDEVLAEQTTKGFVEKIASQPTANHYDLFNFITDTAKSFDVEQKRRLELLAGCMVDYFKDFGRSDEVFPGFIEFKRKEVYKDNN